MTGDLFGTGDRAPRPFDGDAFGTGRAAPDVAGVEPVRVELPPERPSRTTMAAKVAAFFTARPGVWIDGRRVLKIAGCYGWRTRISDVRRAPYNLRIDNRQRKVGGYVVSEYMLVVADTDDLGGAA